MSTDSVASAPLEPTSGRFVPSPDLRRGLLVNGVLGALTAGALWLVSGLLALDEGVVQGFTWSTGLALAAILPQIAILDTFINLGTEARDQWLGNTLAVLLGLGQILGVLLMLGLLGVAIHDVLTLLRDQPNLNEQAFQQALEPTHRSITLFSLVGEVTWALLVAGFFLAIRSQRPEPVPEEAPQLEGGVFP